MLSPADAGLGRVTTSRDEASSFVSQSVVRLRIQGGTLKFARAEPELLFFLCSLESRDDSYAITLGHVAQPSQTLRDSTQGEAHRGSGPLREDCSLSVLTHVAYLRNSTWETYVRKPAWSLSVCSSMARTNSAWRSRSSCNKCSTCSAWERKADVSS